MIFSARLLHVHKARPIERGDWERS